MSHSHGKKRRRYMHVRGHLFMVKSRTKHDIADKSLCGLDLKTATEATGSECQHCETAKEQLWA